MTQSLQCDPRILTPNPWNSNQVSPENEAKLRKSIEEFGFFDAIKVRELADGTLQILGGEHRRDLAISMGLSEVPVLNLGVLDDVTAKKISLLLNTQYGEDDAAALAAILKELGSEEDIQRLFPYSSDDLTVIFSTVDIELDDLELDEGFERAGEDPIDLPEDKPAKAPKTHTVMRFKLTNADAEKITRLIAQTQRDQGLTSSDDLTNAGDALTFLLIVGAA